MDILECIRQRKSIRSYDGKPLRAEDRQKLAAFAAGITTPYGQPIEYRLLDAAAYRLSSGATGADTYIAGKMQRAPHAEEAFGWSFEKLVLYAWSLGVGTVWMAGTLDRPAFERAMELRPGEVMPCISPLGYAVKKFSLRESMMRKGIGADDRRPFGELFFDGCFGVPLAPERAPALAEALEMVRLAPSGLNRQPWRVVVAGNDVHFYEKRSGPAGGWDIQKVDMGIALCHLEAGLAAHGRKGTLLLEDPGLAHPAGTEYIATWQLA